MDKNMMLIVLIFMTIGLIGMVFWYLRAGYSYPHTIDEIADKKEQEKTNLE